MTGTSGAAILVLFCLLGLSMSFMPFQNMIPNGDSVPNPCGDGIWNGVGHIAIGGSGPRNKFGVDFKKAEFEWKAICTLDSDSDGRSNGVELGDPDCEWTAGTAPKLTTGLSHPGICEPIGSDMCNDQESVCVNVL